MKINTTQEAKKISKFIKKKVEEAGKNKAIVAVSGGIDSALSLKLCVDSLGAENVYPVFLPYGNQSTSDSKLIAKHLEIPQINWLEINIRDTVDQVVKLLQAEQDKLRVGNIMARVRMIMVYDTAKHIGGLVVGTENRSEKYLGYFTRFGDEASDIEPIVHLYKTQVRQMVHDLNLPKIFLEKDPSAGLWEEQTDEGELGFSYEDADKVLSDKFDHGMSAEEIARKRQFDIELVNAVLDRVTSSEFKHLVPYVV